MVAGQVHLFKVNEEAADNFMKPGDCKTEVAGVTTPETPPVVHEEHEKVGPIYGVPV